MKERVRVVDRESLVTHRYGFNSRKGLWFLSCGEVIQLAFGTSMVLLGCPLVPEIMHGGAPEVFLHHLESVAIIILTVLVPRRTQKMLARNNTVKATKIVA